MTKWCLTLYLLLLVCKCVSEWVNVFPSVPKVLGVQSEGRFDLDGLVQHKQPAVAKTMTWYWTFTGDLPLLLHLNLLTSV